MPAKRAGALRALGAELETLPDAAVAEAVTTRDSHIGLRHEIEAHRAEQLGIPVLTAALDTSEEEWRVGALGRA